MNIANNFYITFGWMFNVCTSSGKKLAPKQREMFALVYSFTQDNRSLFTASLSYIAQWLDMNRSNAYRVLRSLVDGGLLAPIKYTDSDSQIRVAYQFTNRALQYAPQGGGVVNLTTPAENLQNTENESVNIFTTTDVRGGGVVKLTTPQKRKRKENEKEKENSPHTPYKEKDKEKEKEKEKTDDNASARKANLDEVSQSGSTTYGSMQFGEKNINPSPNPLPTHQEQVLQEAKEKMADQYWRDNLCAITHIKPDEIDGYYERFMQHCAVENKQHTNAADMLRHFRYWLAKQDVYKKQQDYEQRKQRNPKFNDPDETYNSILQGINMAYTEMALEEERKREQQ